MADVYQLAPFILKWEGGFSNRKNDKGGPTNKGVTLSTWRSVGYDKDGDGDIDVDDLKLLTDDEVVSRVLKPHYWDRWSADRIESQSIANMVVDWTWMSGKNAIVGVQKILGVTIDGVVGPKTLAALNSRSPLPLFGAIKQARIAFYKNLCVKRPSDKDNLQGWLNRLEDLKYVS
jgi:lysozyme family protein